MKGLNEMLDRHREEVRGWILERVEAGREKGKGREVEVEVEVLSEART